MWRLNLETQLECSEVYANDRVQKESTVYGLKLSKYSLRNKNHLNRRYYGLPTSSLKRYKSIGSKARKHEETRARIYEDH